MKSINSNQKKHRQGWLWGLLLFLFLLFSAFLLFWWGGYFVRNKIYHGISLSLQEENKGNLPEKISFKGFPFLYKFKDLDFGIVREEVKYQGEDCAFKNKAFAPQNWQFSCEALDLEFMDGSDLQFMDFTLLGKAWLNSALTQKDIFIFSSAGIRFMEAPLVEVGAGESTISIKPEGKDTMIRAHFDQVYFGNPPKVLEKKKQSKKSIKPPKKSIKLAEESTKPTKKGIKKLEEKEPLSSLEQDRSLDSAFSTVLNLEVLLHKTEALFLEAPLSGDKALRLTKEGFSGVQYQNWMRNGGVVEIKNIRLSLQENVFLQIVGQLALDSDFRPQGVISIRFGGHEEDLRAFVNTLVSGDHADSVNYLYLMIYSLSKGDEKQRTLTIQAENGKLSIGGISFGSLSPIYPKEEIKPE